MTSPRRHVRIHAVEIQFLEVVDEESDRRRSVVECTFVVSVMGQAEPGRRFGRGKRRFGQANEIIHKTLKVIGRKGMQVGDAVGQRLQTLMSSGFSFFCGSESIAVRDQIAPSAADTRRPLMVCGMP